MTMQVYQQIRPCIDATGHKFTAGVSRIVVCERCGMTRDEVQRR